MYVAKRLRKMVMILQPLKPSAALRQSIRDLAKCLVSPSSALCFAASFCWYWFPDFIFPALTSTSSAG
jgi:hypothetical protein